MKDLELQELIKNSNRIVAFTGAGISAESGIPTYRGHGGYWTKYDPMKYASIDYFFKDPTYYWEFFREVRHDLMITAEPNKGHLALVSLEKQGKLHTVITQNIDGLHQKAGSSNVLELHGNTHHFYCVSCGDHYSIGDVFEKLKTEMPPRCAKCETLIRPDVVLFGEMLPQDVLLESAKAIGDCDLLLSIGSSLQVYPAADFPIRAKMRGAKLVIINMDPTPFDSYADIVINEQAGEVLGFLL